MPNKDLTIHLKIKTLRIPVTEKLPVIVIWNRDKKRAQTKKRLLSDNVAETVFDEEFQITTSMGCDDAGTPSRPKMVSASLVRQPTHFRSNKIASTSYLTLTLPFPSLHTLFHYSLISPSPATSNAESSGNASSTWLSSTMTITGFTAST